MTAPQDSAVSESVAATPALRVIDAHATPEEIAAIVTVLSSLGGGVEPARRPQRSQWAHPGRQMQPAPAVAPGRGGWRASALPR
ncbi:acyl-CoA carboxylase subunit epsilon [Nocardioides sp. BP30]|uniref:acyl-CoA carboxylase subunit epsilon n=1 Tax=Nocardioides sp. BP30 TaxID=3036374 RepID=UPI0024684677|nr:acyl-CoA carboxylase subunit epsilon [Nocardioides sp. BP30]WGL51548.1 acyl-CoA carboxylase subunit epsilon [Nocardioides sp. BP30]